MSEPAIVCAGLRRVFDDGLALDSLDLEVQPGTVLALLGPNGAGKTTTVRLLNGILRPTAGWSRVLGLDPQTQGHELRHRTGVLTENAGLDDRLTARENLMVTARLRGIDPRTARVRVGELLERFGMTSHAGQRCQGYSTGQRRRIALARALISDPELLFLDEPTSGLDPAATDDVIDLIDSLAKDRGRTVVLCTHFLAEATRVADQMAILNRGLLLVSGSPRELADELWPEIELQIELEAPATESMLDALARVGGVCSADATPAGATVSITDRQVTPAVIDAIVSGGGRVFAALPTERTLADVYFAYEERLDPVHRGLRAADAPTNSTILEQASA